MRQPSNPQYEFYNPMEIHRSGCFVVLWLPRPRGKIINYEELRNLSLSAARSVDLLRRFLIAFLLFDLGDFGFLCRLYCTYEFLSLISYYCTRWWDWTDRQFHIF